MYYLTRRKAAPKANSADGGLPVFGPPRRKTADRTRARLVRQADEAFSRYIRLRDSSPDGTFRCISCGRTLPTDEADCGHYHSRRHMGTRYDEDNAHSECRSCNRFKADHLIGYERNLIAKIGRMRFDKLAWKAAQPMKWTDKELEELAAYYKERNKELRKEKGL